MSDTHQDYDHRSRPEATSRTIAGLLGAFFVIAGIFGLFLHHRTGVQFSGRSGTGLIHGNIFEVNKLHSVVMIVLGAVLLLASAVKRGMLRLICLAAGIFCIVFAIYGLITRDHGGDKFAFNGWDALLYFLAGALLLAAAVLAHLRHREADAPNRQFRVGARVAPRNAR